MGRIYTKTGDQGMTSLLTGERVPKDHFRTEAQGTVDELNAELGLLRALPEIPDNIATVLTELQHDLFAMGAQLGQPDKSWLEESRVTTLEQSIDKLEADLPELSAFILPAGGMAAAQCHVCRTICRRAERRLVTLGKIETFAPVLLTYLNRLSDWLFVAARSLAQASGEGDVLWEQTR